MIRSLTCMLALCAMTLCSGPVAVADPLPVPAATPTAPGASSAAPGAAAAGLQAKIVTVNPRLTRHKGRLLRVFVRNRGTSASARGTIRLRVRPGLQPAFMTEAQHLPAIAPGGEVSRTFSVPRHLRALPPLSRLEAVATIEGEEIALPSFTANHAVQRPVLPVLPGPALMGPVPAK